MPGIMTNTAHATFLLEKISEFSLEGLLVFIFATIVLWFMRNTSAAIRHDIIIMLMTCLIILPVVTLSIPGRNLSIFPAISTDGSSAETSALAANHLNDQGKENGTVDADNQPATTTANRQERSGIDLPGLLQAAVVAWFGIAILLLIWQWSGKRAARRLVKGSQPIADLRWADLLSELQKQQNIQRKIDIRQSDEILIPLVAGIRRPVLLIPAGTESWPAGSLQTALLHELAHIKRHDLLSQLLAQIVCALYWWNPLAWITAHQLFIERERASDDFVLNRGVKASEYARDLLSISTLTKSARRRLSLNVAAMARGTDFRDRMVYVLDPVAGRKSLSVIGRILAGVAIISLFLPLAAFSPWTSPLPLATGPIVDPAPQHADTSESDTDENKPMIREEQVADFVDLLNDPDPSIRLQTIRFLSRVQNTTSFPSLVEAVIRNLNDPDSSIRYNACWIVNRLDDPDRYEGLPETMVKLLRDENDSIRYKAVDFFSGLGNPGAQPGASEAFLHMLNTDTPTLRMRALEILVSLPDAAERPDIVEAAMKAVVSDNIERTKLVALEFLRKSNRPELKARLKETLQAASKDPLPRVRVLALEMLVQLE